MNSLSKWGFLNRWSIDVYCWHSKKDKIPDWPEQCLTCWHLQKTSDRQADDQFLPIPEGQISDLDSTDPVKQTVSPDCLWRDLSGSKMLG